MKKDDVIRFSAFWLFGGLVSFAVIYAFFISDDPGGVPFAPDRSDGYYYFTDNLDNAVVSGDGKVNLTILNIKKRKMKSIFAHPVSAVEYGGLAVKENTILAVSLGMSPKMWEKDGDGVKFTVSVKKEGSPPLPVFVKMIDPCRKKEDRKWTDVEISLPVNGESIGIIFETEQGPLGDRSYDWAYWGDPRLKAIN